MSESTVTDTRTGHVYAVPMGTCTKDHGCTHGGSSRPKNADRTRKASVGVTVSDGMTRTACCGKLVGTTGEVTHGDFIIAVGECDRVVNDHPDFTVSHPVHYSESTLVWTCKAHNGSGRRTESEVRESLYVAALDRLQRYGRRVA